MIEAMAVRNMANNIGIQRFTILEAEDRISKMELYFDLLQHTAAIDPAMVRKDPSHRELLDILTRYYESGQWLRDYELDEQGLLPKELKRGVLAQDAVYNFLEQINTYEGSI